MTIDMDGKAQEAKITGDNEIALDFVTGEHDGQYFYYTGDLFLLYKAPRKIAKLTCTRM